MLKVVKILFLAGSSYSLVETLTHFCCRMYRLAHNAQRHWRTDRRTDNNHTAWQYDRHKKTSDIHVRCCMQFRTMLKTGLGNCF